MMEQLDTVFCPACGGTMNVPRRNWGGGETQQSFKICSCEPFPSVLHPDQEPGKSLHDVQIDVYNLKRWMNIVARLIPQGQGKSYNGGVYLQEDLHNKKLSLPEHVLAALLKSKEVEIRVAHDTSGAELFVKVCLYCGHVRFSHSGAAKGEIRLLNYQICNDCDRFKSTDPEAFKWVSKVMQFGYVRAPDQMMPVMPPPPPPPALEPQKAITLDE